MKSSLRKLRGLAHKGDSKEKQDHRHRHRKPARLDELVQATQQSHMIRPSWYPAKTYLGDQKQELKQNLIIIGCILGFVIILGCIFCCLLKRHLQLQAAHAALASPPPHGLDRQQIEMFEVSPYAPPTRIDTELEECPICQEKYESGELRRILTCGHDYHMECVDVWLSSHRTCPECRREYP